MRLAIVAVVAAFSAACSACSGRALPQEIPGIPLDTDPSVAISMPAGGAAHACPVAGYLVTAKHVLAQRDGTFAVAVAWSHRGHEGFARSLVSHAAMDLTILLPDPGSPPLVYLPQGRAVVGQRVYWFEYDFRSTANLLRTRRRMATVLRVVAGLVVFDSAPTPGASGTCLIGEGGDVVGIVTTTWYSPYTKPLTALGGTAVQLPQLPAKEN